MGLPTSRTLHPTRFPQALIYFAVSKKGEPPIDGVTDVNPEGLTSTCGKWAGEFKQRLANGGLTCHELSEDRCVVVKIAAGIYVDFLPRMWACKVLHEIPPRQSKNCFMPPRPYEYSRGVREDRCPRREATLANNTSTSSTWGSRAE